MIGGADPDAAVPGGRGRSADPRARRRGVRGRAGPRRPRPKAPRRLPTTAVSNTVPLGAAADRVHDAPREPPKNFGHHVEPFVSLAVMETEQVLCSPQ